MSLFFDQLFTLLTTPPGNFIYHIVLVISVGVSLIKAIQLLHSTQFPQARRMVFGLGVLLALQALLFKAGGLVRVGLLDPQLLLPALDRAITLLALVWIIWLWVFPEPMRLADFSTVLLNLLVLTCLGLTMLFQVHTPGTNFNNSTFETIWQCFSLLVILLGIFGLVLRKANGWGNGLAMLLLAFSGHLASLFWRGEGEFPGFVRLAQLALFPILLTINQRFPGVDSKRVPVARTDTVEDENILEPRTTRTDPKTLHAMMSLAAEDDMQKIGFAVTRGISQAMLADLCFLLFQAEDKTLTIACGYDLIREENLDGAAVNKEAVPLLASSVQDGRSLHLPSSSTSSDLKNLGKMLGLSNPGNLLSVPIISPQRGPLGSILILSPYSGQQWISDDQVYLLEISNLIVPILERGQRRSLLEAERDQAQQVAQTAQQQAVEARTKYEDTAKELEQAHEKVTQSQLQAENMTALLSMQEESQKTIETLKAQIEQMHQSAEAGSAPIESTQLEHQLHDTLEEMARMQNALADANEKIVELEQRPPGAITNEQLEVIASITQELRQPMSSIVGYTDLLLGESIGILGALQRKFIERIKASTERIGGLVNDLIQITNLEAGKLEFKAEVIDLNLIIDNAMAYTGMQIREKNITLRLDIIEAALRIQTDQDALQQIFIHLLQNATAATQNEGAITLRIKVQNEANKDFIAIQVTDTGGGIAPDDIPRIFARRYRAEHSIIQGLGDTGVGLSIAKALVEAQGGRIWIETEAGIGSTFSVLLPVLLETEKEA
jgi:signal transduction histidine kinase